MREQDDRPVVIAAGEAILGEGSFHAAARSRTTDAWWRELADRVCTPLTCKHGDGTLRIELPGCPRCYLDWRGGSGDSVEIFDIAVCNEHRGRNRGRILVELLFALCGSTHLVWAITRADNRPAQLFYEALRFRVVANLYEFHGTEGRMDAVMYGRSPRGPV